MLKEKIKNTLIILNSLPLNIKLFGIREGIKVPILININVKVMGVTKNNITITSKLHHGMIRIGLNASHFIGKSTSSICITNGGLLKIGDDVTFGEGINIFINGGTLTINDRFYSNANLLIQCENTVTINSDCLIGWNVQIRDTDGGHQVIKNDKTAINKNKLIEIGSHNWIASDCILLANNKIGDNNIIACNSLVKGINCTNNNLIAGSPAKIKEGEYNWKE